MLFVRGELRDEMQPVRIPDHWSLILNPRSSNPLIDESLIGETMNLLRGCKDARIRGWRIQGWGIRDRWSV